MEEKSLIPKSICFTELKVINSLESIYRKIYYSTLFVKAIEIGTEIKLIKSE